MEDLWAFNEEIVARAIFEAKTPIISGTGHETDTTIADYASDLRAPTPSAACELAIPDIFAVLDKLAGYERRLSLYMNDKIRRRKERLDSYSKMLQYLHPENRLLDYKMTHGRLHEQINKSMDRKPEQYWSDTAADRSRHCRRTAPAWQRSPLPYLPAGSGWNL